MATLSLAGVLDLAAAAPLQASLLAHRGQDLELDGSTVQRLGGQCLQIILAARATWEADGRALRLRDISEAGRDALAVMGAGRLLGTEE